MEKVPHKTVPSIIWPHVSKMTYLAQLLTLSIIVITDFQENCSALGVDYMSCTGPGTRGGRLFAIT